MGFRPNVGDKVKLRSPLIDDDNRVIVQKGTIGTVIYVGGVTGYDVQWPSGLKTPVYRRDFVRP